MSIQFKSITELNELLDNKLISASELTQESIKLAKKCPKISFSGLGTIRQQLDKKNLKKGLAEVP